MRGLTYTGVGIYVGCMVSNDFYYISKRILFQPIKNFVFVLNDFNHFFILQDWFLYFGNNQRENWDQF